MLLTLPFENAEQWETRAVLKNAAEAHRYLAEPKGVVENNSNEKILVNTLTLQEAWHRPEESGNRRSRI